MKVLVCGGRDLEVTDARVRLVANLLRLVGATEVIHGAARGGDQIGKLAGKKLGLPVTAVPAKWP